MGRREGQEKRALRARGPCIYSMGMGWRGAEILLHKHRQLWWTGVWCVRCTPEVLEKVIRRGTSV